MMKSRSLEVVLDTLGNRIEFLEAEVYVKESEVKRLREENARLSEEVAKLERALEVYVNGKGN